MVWHALAAPSPLLGMVVVQATCYMVVVSPLVVHQEGRAASKRDFGNDLVTSNSGSRLGCYGDSIVSGDSDLHGAAQL